MSDHDTKATQRVGMDFTLPLWGDVSSTGLDPKKWGLRKSKGNPQKAARWATDNQGRLYDWQLILGGLSWLIPQKKSRVTCSEACGEMEGYDEAWRLDPCTLDVVTRSPSQLHV